MIKGGANIPEIILGPLEVMKLTGIVVSYKKGNWNYVIIRT
jgi:hypothetical protein